MLGVTSDWWGGGGGVALGSEGMGKRKKGERLGGVEKKKVETICDQ
jgi:hypothetical protein